MKKRLALCLAALLLACAPFALAAAPDAYLTAAQAYLPQDAALRETEWDDGCWELTFVSASENRVYEIEVEETTHIARKIAWEAIGLRGSERQTATEAQARAAVLALYPQARVDSVTIDIDDGLYEYEIAYAIDGYAGLAELEAGACAWLGNELTYTGAPLAGAGQPVGIERAAQLALERAGGGMVVEIERDDDDGRVVYEGEVLLDGMEYEFEIDAATGTFLQWESERTD